MHSVSDLTTFARKTLGDVPPRLVGASTAVVGDKVYLFGGRLVSERKMVSDMYVFDLKTFVWTRLDNANDPEMPSPRYFHSMDLWNNHLVIFGGMGYKAGAQTVDDYCVLDDMHYFDIAAQRWLPFVQPVEVTEEFIPRARYAHLSAVTGDRLYVIGGQDLSNVWLDEIHILDLNSQQWIHRSRYTRHCGTYRSVLVSSPARVRNPQQEQVQLPGPVGARFREANRPPSPDSLQCTPSESLQHLPYSADPTEEFPSDILLYSNYNFTDVKRELEIFSPIPDEDHYQINDKSAAMSGTALPPGLRFPTGAVLGNHFILAGIYLASSYQSFSIWALDLTTMTWARIDPGSTLASGSWCRACLWASSNKFVVFGNRQGSLLDDYNRRLLTWDHVAYIDLEAFGIYQPPILSLSPAAQELGLAALEERAFTDFEVTCDDERRIACSRRVLEQRWPWFREQRRLYQQAATEALKSVTQPGTPVPLPEVAVAGAPGQPDTRLDPRLTPRTLRMAEPYPVVLAFVQYLYTQALITPLQHSPAVLSGLLVLASTYELLHLRDIVVHAMHRALSAATSVGVYEVATLCNCQSLQIRALKVVMSSSRKPGARSRGDRTDSNGRGSTRVSESNGAARPRGMSETVQPPGSNQPSRMMNGASQNGYSNAGMYRAPAPVNSAMLPSPTSPATPSTLYTPDGEVLKVAPLRAEPIRPQHPLRTRGESLSGSTFAAQPAQRAELPTSPVDQSPDGMPRFHLPFRATSQSNLADLVRSGAGTSSRAPSRPVTGSTISSVDELVSPSLSHASSVESMVMTPPDSPHRTAHVLEDDARTLGSSTPTLKGPLFRRDEEQMQKPSDLKMATAGSPVEPTSPVANFKSSLLGRTPKPELMAAALRLHSRDALNTAAPVFGHNPALHL